ncbi:Hypothetical predicted protein [Mytilus galloprovincialis]|uniref:Uncharacterized protein n=1 Tax=Mytilus galloprovincialis TaxID=29158 RepID=A0A8B6E2T8_MYTGA|nr:Hypothetical predicted protein [Mytilus galloprovincialis]
METDYESFDENSDNEEHVSGCVDGATGRDRKNENILSVSGSRFKQSQLKKSVKTRRNIMKFFPKVDKVKVRSAPYVKKGGDWNTTLSDLDRCTKTGHKVDNAFRKLEHLMNDSDLYDIWRFRNPNKRVFSRKMIYNGVLKQSRLDYFFGE